MGKKKTKHKNLNFSYNHYRNMGKLNLHSTNIISYDSNPRTICICCRRDRLLSIISSPIYFSSVDFSIIIFQSRRVFHFSELRGKKNSI